MSRSRLCPRRGCLFLSVSLDSRIYVWCRLPSHTLLKVSTTVVNPSLWMPMYEASRANAIFFIFFIIVSVFYLHSLVLSVVFQTYIHAATEIHSRSVMDREEAIRRAFLALLREESSEYISATSVRKTLQVVRPHYNPMKVGR